MSERKNIDRLFQEKFKEFELDAPSDSWNNIEAKLEEKKKRRVVPFWWKFSGVAALLVLGVFIWKSNTETDIISVPNETVVEKNTTKKPNNDLTIDNKIEDKIAINEKVDSSSQSEQNTTISSSIIANESRIISENDNQQKTVSSSSKRLLKHKINSKNSIITKNEVLNNSSNNVATNKNKTTESNVISDSKIDNESTLDVKNNSITENSSINKTTEKTTIETQKSFDTKTESTTALKTETPKKSNDSIPTNTIAKNELEELLNEKESKLKTESKNNRWQISSNVAPIFLGSVSNGSPIDSMFVENKKDFNTDLSVGLGVSYAINSKFSIRTGINKMRFSYNTNDVAFTASLQASSMRNIDFSPQAQMMQIHSSSTVQTSDIVPLTGSETSITEGEINQQMGYLEIPLELSYALLDKKFGIKIIGGMSTFFLDENKVSIISEDMNMTLGKANNLNEVHFSSNIGIGLHYNFWKSFDATFEPTLKYQLNTFSKSDGDFKPYFVGVYTGISYKF